MKKWGLIHLKKKMKGRNFKYTCPSWLCLFIFAAPLQAHVTILRVIDDTPSSSLFSVWHQYMWDDWAENGCYAPSDPPLGKNSFVSLQKRRVIVFELRWSPLTCVVSDQDFEFWIRLRQGWLPSANFPRRFWPFRVSSLQISNQVPCFPTDYVHLET